jgi:hypothetical protein
MLSLYHGSNKELRIPQYGFCKEATEYDYGIGFYLTPDLNMADEWAVQFHGDNAVCNEYVLNTEGLTILDLDTKGVLVWVAELLKNRQSLWRDSNCEADVLAFLNRYAVREDYDVIKGFRADTTDFQQVYDFARNTLSYKVLDKSLRCGNLGEQICLKSKLAFNRLTFVGAEKVDSFIYEGKGKIREANANQLYERLTAHPDNQTPTKIKNLI